MSDFTDPEFPPDVRMCFRGSPDPPNFCYGQWRKKSFKEIESLLLWVPLKGDEFASPQNRLFDGTEDEGRPICMDMFEGKVEAEDIEQGRLGNCWFLSSMAGIAEKFPNLVESLFVQVPKRNNRECKIRLFNPFTEDWEIVTIDDYMPVFSKKYRGCAKFTPFFCRPNKMEMWALLLEKAFAKFHGGYAYLKGGYARHAMRVLTGKPIQGWKKCKPDYWKNYEIQYKPKFVNKIEEYPSERFTLKSKPQRGHKDTSEILDIMLEQLGRGNALACGFKEAGTGIQKGHSYSFLNMFPNGDADAKFLSDNSIDMGDAILLQFRNPYGNGEWEGDWCDNDPRWDEYTNLREYLDVVEENDGTFWMDYDSWSQKVSKIDICEIN